MLTNKPIYILLLSFAIISCNPLNKDLPVQATIEIDNKKMVDENKFMGSLNKIEFIKLKYGDKGVIGQIDQVLSYNNQFFVLDKLQKKILVFSADGTYKYEIYRYGKNDNEYKGITWFDIIAKENKIVVYDRNSTKLIWYTLNGDFIKKITTNSYFNKFKIIPEKNSIFVHYGHEPRHIKFESNGRDALIEYDLTDFKIKNKYFAYESNFEKMEIKLPNNFLFDNHELLYYKPFDNSIYSFHEADLSIKYKFTFKSPFIDKGTMEKYKKINVVLTEVTNKDMVWTLSSFKQNSNSIKLNYAWSKFVNATIINKNDNSCMTILGSEQKSPLSIFLGDTYCMHNNMFVDVIVPERLIELQKVVSKNRLKGLNIPEDIQELDNPYLLLYNFK